MTGSPDSADPAQVMAYRSTRLLCFLIPVWMTGGCAIWLSADGLEDYDGDGAPAEGVAGVADCDDFNADIYPGADEICDGIDNNCNGLSDSEDSTLVEGVLFFRDRDEDGLGWAEDERSACEIPSGYVDNDEDCSDDDAEIGAASTWYPDEDKDHFGDENSEGVVACVQPDEDSVPNQGDCDDSDPQFNPGVTEFDCEDEDAQDFNCDGLVGSIDSDGDGFPACEECDDSNPDIHPDAVEVCDGVDNDCSGEPDDNSPEGSTPYFPDRDGDGLANLDEMWMACETFLGWVRTTEEDCDDSSADIGGPSTWYRDQDGDLFGDISDDGLEQCDQPFSHVANHGDCDDSDSGVNPGVVESCSSQFDLNCDGEVGEGDADGDGFSACEDCNDGDSSIFPDAEEVCDGEDNDCQNGPDGADAIDPVEWFLDADGDGYGDSDNSIFGCDMPEGYMANAFDCDDDEASVHPNAAELCDGLNNACSSLPSDEIDNDGDGYVECEIDEDGWDGHEDVGGGGDCDDSDAGVFPTAEEQCNGIDDDCDGQVDEDVTSAGLSWFEDADGDGYGDENGSPLESCTQPSGYVEDSTDCDDSDSAVNPSDNDGDGERDFCRWTAVSSGNAHSCAIDYNGDLHCWGQGESGLNDVCSTITTPPTGGPYIEVSAGMFYTCAIRETGAVECWGCDGAADWVDPPTSFNFTEVHVGPSSVACGVDESKNGHCWGDPSVVMVPLSAEGPYQQLIAGSGFLCFLQEDGLILCESDFGMGDSITLAPGGFHTFITTQFLHACALALDETVACWGQNDNQQTDAPGGTFVDVEAGMEHSCGIDSNGALVCWGCAVSDVGQCDSPEGEFKDLGVGYKHNCAIDTSGLLQCWGQDDEGESTPP